MEQTKNIFSKARAIVPGIITAALVFGPSKMTITSRLGADYGYSMLWVVVLAIFFMMVFGFPPFSFGNNSSSV